MSALPRLAIVGTGLMGASIGLAARRAGGWRVTGFDADPSAAEVALARGALDEVAATLADAVGEADLAVVAVPVGRLPTVVREALAGAPERCTVTDVGSTKESVCAAAAGADRFVGGHPVCGSEASGPEHAAAELFEGATWFLTPVAETDAGRYRFVHAFVAGLGSAPVAIAPAAHDRLAALTSHLPHVLANLLANQAGALLVDGHDPLAAAGGSLRDMTRVAGANPQVWVDILLDNRREMLEALAEHRSAVAILTKALEDGDAAAIATWIEQAAANRRRVLRAAYASDPGDLYRLRVRVTDEPGVLAGVTRTLGAERINIADFELRHLSPERGGWLGILVAGERPSRRAAELLEAEGYGVVLAPAATGG